jgi:hypothetical protein
MISAVYWTQTRSHCRLNAACVSFRHGVCRNEAINNVWTLKIQALAFNLKSRQMKKKANKIHVA